MPCGRQEIQLLCCLIRLLLRLLLHPSAIDEQRKDADRDYEDNAEHQNHTRVPAGPVVPSFDEGVKCSSSAMSVDQVDRSHFLWSGAQQR